MTDTPPVPPANPSTPAPTPPPATDVPVPEEVAYRDDDLVYVDPDTRTIVGRVEWSRNGNPKSMPVKREEAPSSDAAAKGERRKGGGRKHYPWGTYKSMKGAFKLLGKQKKGDPNKTLDDVLEKALKEPFWE